MSKELKEVARGEDWRQFRACHVESTKNVVWAKSRVFALMEKFTERCQTKERESHHSE